MLDADWDHLIADPDKPFFNRVLQGSYQPGGMLQTPLMAAALAQQVSLSTLVENANQTVSLEDVELGCALRIPFTELGLRDAYAFACPRPFAELAQELGAAQLDGFMQTFRFDQPVGIQNYLPEETSETTPVFSLDDSTLVDNALGQGDLTVTPLQIALFTAAIINDGNAPRPYLLAATQAPGASTWANARNSFPTMPFSTQNTARELQDLMRYTVANGATLNAARPGIDIGGHAALAFSGEESLAWFTGFATLAGRRGVAVAVVLENSADPGLAADIGGTILAAAHDSLTQP
jgi:peptidoglycan glycosyltransferase